MSGRGRRAPEPAIPVGQGDPLIAPPPPPGAPWEPPAEHVLRSTDPADNPEFEEDVPEVAGTLVGEPLGDPEDEGDALSPEEELMFSTLLTCGRRSKTIKVMDHTVVVQTLNNDDDLRIGLWIKDYQGSLGEQRAYQVGVAAAGIRSIDGKPVVKTLFQEADQDALFAEKVAIVQKMYPHATRRIYDAVIDAEKEFVQLVETLGKSNG